MNKLPPINPCPFCGKKAALWEDTLFQYVVCETQSTCGLIGPVRKTARGAVLAWNRITLKGGK